jgi:UPF0716 protein FxsA
VPIILIAIVCWPFIEIAGFIYVGEHIGILPTIALILASSALGAALLRVQGIAVLQKMQAEMRAGRVPARELGHGAFITLAGLCLLIPGFISDIIGLLLFLPPVRALILTLLARNVHIVVRSSSSRRPGVVDLEREEWHEVSVTSGDAPHPDGPPRRLGGPQD